MSDLMVYTYETEDEAAVVLNRVAAVKKDNIQEAAVAIRDAAVVVKRDNGKVKVSQTLEALVKGSRVMGGGFWGILIGFLFGGPLLGGLVGMGLRAFGNRKIDIGIDNQFITDVSEALQPGQSALFLLTADTPAEVIGEALGEHNGTLHHTSFSEEAAEALGQLAEQEELVEALEANEA